MFSMGIHCTPFTQTNNRLENQEYDDICVRRAAANQEEIHIYQTLKLNEMNYESMYAKITTIGK